MRRDHDRNQHASVRHRQHGRTRHRTSAGRIVLRRNRPRQSKSSAAESASPKPAATGATSRPARAADGAGYVLNGRKIFTSLSPVIDLFMVMATIEDSQSTRGGKLSSSTRHPGLELIETWDAMGMRATASHDLLIKDVHVPAIAMAESRPIGPVNETRDFTVRMVRHLGRSDLHRYRDRRAEIRQRIFRTPEAASRCRARSAICPEFNSRSQRPRR